MNIDWGLLASLMLNVALILVVLSQSRKIAVLRKEMKQPFPMEPNEELIDAAREKLKTVGDIKTIKYVREETGMSLLDAKNFVDSLEE